MIYGSSLQLVSVVDEREGPKESTAWFYLMNLRRKNMGILDKAKDLLGQASDRLKDPDKDLVEKAWPLGGTDDKNLPQEGDDLDDEGPDEEKFTESIDGEEEPGAPSIDEWVTGTDRELTDQEMESPEK